MCATCDLDKDFLKSGVQASLNRVVEHCAEAFDCSIALVSLLDEAEQKFVAKVGTKLEGTPREISFCRHVVESGEDLLVEDATKDDRFCTNPLVIDEPKIRFYAGCGISNSSGNLIGALCLVDQRPGRFGRDSLEIFKRFAEVVSDLIRLQESQALTYSLTGRLVEQRDALMSAKRVSDQSERIAKMGSWQVELETGVVYWSDGACRIHGVKPGTEIDLNTAIDFHYEGEHAKIQELFERAISNGKPFEFESTIRLPEGGTRYVRSVGEYIPGDGNSRARMVGVIIDITEEYDSQAALEHAANFDNLTGFFNRHAFDRLLQVRLNKHNETGEDVIVLLLDLDGFKDVNDTFGHITGDVILEEISKRIKSAALDGSPVSRWGGDEFVVVLPLGTKMEGAVDYARSVLDKIRHETVIGDRVITMSATCGIARSEKRISARELIRRADIALYHGKKRNPGSITTYSPLIEKDNHYRLEAISEVREALRCKRMFAGYQPIVDLNSRNWVGFEALLRLHSRRDRKLTATEVLPGLIEPSLSRQVSKQMTALIAREVSELFEAVPEARFVSVNATEGDLLSTNFAREFVTAFQEYGVNLDRITLEVTETMLLVNDTDAVTSVLAQLKTAGIKIALDDFGTGFSSLSHLRDFPIDKVKIDGSFIQSMPTTHQARLIVQAIIGMAKGLGIEIIGEGVETHEQRSLLQQMGCSLGQGFLFSPALDVSQVVLRSMRNKACKALPKKVA